MASLRPHKLPGAVGGALCLVVALAALVLASCSSDLGVEQKRFLCDSDADCLDGFVCQAVEDADGRECVSANGQPTDVSSIDATDAGDTTRSADARDTTSSADATEDADDAANTCAPCGRFCQCQDDQCMSGDGSAASELEQNCTDEIDNDCDGDIDCADSECEQSLACSSDHIIFVTSRNYLAENISNPDEVDEQCTLLGMNLGRQNWKALIPEVGQGDGQTVRERVSIDGPVKNVRDELIASNEDDLWDGSLGHAIRYDERNSAIEDAVWTSYDASGEPVSCSDGTVEDIQMAVGSSQHADSRWAKSGCRLSSESAHFYCISQ